MPGHAQSTAISLGTIVAPLFAGPLVAWSLTNGATSPPFNHFFVFLISAAIMLLISAMAFAMPRSLEQPLPEDADAGGEAGGEGAGGEKASLLRASEEE